MDRIELGLNRLTLIADVLLYVLLFAAFYGLLHSVFVRRPASSRRWLSYRRRGDSRASIYRWLFIPKPTHATYQAKQRLLSGSGIRIHAGLYMAFARVLFIVNVSFGFILFFLRTYSPQSISQTDSLLGLCIVSSILTILLIDHRILEMLQRVRRYRIMRDIDVISRQLLYYSGVSGNLHSKLMRCLPFAKALSSEWYLLTGEWYQNAGYALHRFQERVATEEGRSFAETLNALRQHDHDRYYELLKQRISDNKEKLELFKDGRKETLSYLLFVMSGVPILYTFRLFVYPWVSEGQKLFDSLG